MSEHRLPDDEALLEGLLSGSLDIDAPEARARLNVIRLGTA